MCLSHAKLPKSYFEAKEAMSDELTDSDIDKFRKFLTYCMNAFTREQDPVLWDGCDDLYLHLLFGNPWEFLKKGRDAALKLAAEREAEKAAKST